jgi:indolepyruvate ferredoxin oxidoreductase alpha subunit
MTGMQEHPATGFTLQGEETKSLDFATLASALGIDSVRVIDPYDIKNTRTVIKEELSKDGPSVVISRRACALLNRNQTEVRKPLKINPEKCTGCKACLELGCPSISWKNFENMPESDVKKKTKKQKGIAVIDSSLCSGCTLCQQLCSAGAIEEV